MAFIRKVINCSDVPAAIGPYSHAILTGKTLYASGVIGLDKTTMELVGNDTGTQLQQVFRNLESILKEAGSSFSNVVKTTVFLTDLNDTPHVNKIYQEYFKENFPARSMVQVSRLPKDAKVEIEAIALVGCVKTIPPLKSKLC